MNDIENKLLQLELQDQEERSTTPIGATGSKRMFERKKKLKNTQKNELEN